jgi:hypothetical protein
MDDALLQLIAEMQGDIGHLSDGLLGGQLSPVEWHNEMAHLIGLYESAAFFAGSGADTLNTEAQRLLLDKIGGQVDYLNGFTDDVEAGGLSDEQTRARALLYSGAMKEVYSRAATLGWSLPFYPAEGTECKVNCGCSWLIDIIDQENGDADATWLRSFDDSCKTCVDREGGNPYQIREGELM